MFSSSSTTAEKVDLSGELAQVERNTFHIPAGVGSERRVGHSTAPLEHKVKGLAQGPNSNRNIADCACCNLG